MTGALVLGAAAILLFVSIWIVVPVPNQPLLPLGVGAPEVSPLLVLAAVAICALAWVGARSSPAGRIAIGLAAVAAVLSASPLARMPATVQRFDQAMAVAIGNNVLSGVPSDVQRRMRPRPLVARDLLLGIDPGASIVQRDIRFAAPDGIPLVLTVYRPGFPGRFPILVQIYGGAWQRGGPDDDALFARYFASRGYVVVALDYRHAPQWKWPAQGEDVATGLGWIAAHAAEYGGDADRIALIGRSSGAQLALTAAYRAGAPGIRAVVSYYGPVDLTEGWRHPPTPDPLDVRAVIESYLGGNPDQMPERYRDASPITYVSARLPPTLLIYGTRDHIVEARFGRMLHDRLRATGDTAVLLEIPWAEHAFDALPSGLSGQLSLYYTERFLAWAFTKQ